MLQSPQNFGPKVLQIVWAALLGSQIVYGVVLPQAIRDNEPREYQMPYVFGLSTLGVLAPIVGYFIYKWFLAQAKRDLIEKYGQRPNYDISTLAAYYNTPYIFRMALTETCAIAGFGLSFIHMRTELYYPFAALTLGIFLLNFPTEEKIKNAFK